MIIKEKLVDLTRRLGGQQVTDKEISDYLQKKYKDVHGDSFDDAQQEITGYFDDLELRPELLKKKKILDIGSNKHFFDEYCKKKYDSEVVALDIGEESLGKSHELGVLADARKLPFKDQAFHLVVSHASMPHLFAPYRDGNDSVIPIEGAIEATSLEDIMAVFREAYRVTEKGGQIRMSTFSEAEVRELSKERRFHIAEDGSEKVLNPTEENKQMLDRVFLVKKALNQFEKDSGSRCMFKDMKHGGLIIIRK